MSGIICCGCSILAVLVLQFALIQWRNDLNKIQEESKSQQNRDLLMNLTARTPSFVSSWTSVSPVKKHYGCQDPWKSVAGEDRSGRPDKGTDFFLKPLIFTSTLKSFSKVEDNCAWSSQGYDWSGRPDKLGKWYENFDLITRKFFLTEPRNP